jgi:hypothetical protein
MLVATSPGSYSSGSTGGPTHRAATPAHAAISGDQQMTQDNGHQYTGPEGQVPPPYGSNPAGPVPQGQPYGQQPYGQPYGQQPYAPQPYGYGYPPPRRTNGFAIASMVLGIVWVYWIGSILALVFGYIARKQIRERGDAGNGMAIAGIVLGWVGVGVLVLALVFGIASSA